MLDDLIKEKIKKLRLYQQKQDPYPARVNRDYPISQFLADFSKFLSSKQEVYLVGRITSLRDQGKIIFADLNDSSGRIQIILKKDQTGEFDFMAQVLDVGDFVEALGQAFVTKKGENSLELKKIRIISKSIRPWPSSWYGLEDTELRFRKRYLDSAINPEVRSLFVKKSIFWQTVRNFLVANGFLEVETPVLEAVPGGAEAEPFVTHHNALDQDFYLRISLELPLKKMLVGGFEKVFEIGRIFRNEGIDREHLQDYTQMECYLAYADYRDVMDLTGAMYKKIVFNLFNSYQTQSGGQTLNWDGDWPVVDYYEIFAEYAGLNLKTATSDDLRRKAKELGLEVTPALGKGRLIDLIFKHTARPRLIQPSFLVDPPVEIEPLAKRKPDDPGRVERFQIVAAGTELGKGFSELNDPLDQRQRFEEQMKLRQKGDKEAQMMNDEFVEALEYGMPPAGGFGMSERLFAVLMDKSVREAVYFPLMKPEKQN